MRRRTRSQAPKAQNNRKGKERQTMNKETLKEAFSEAKKAAALDFSITNPDRLGDCQSCVWSALCNKYGADSHGIWVKHWHHGVNRGEAIEDLTTVYIAHDLTEEQAKAVFAVLEKYYTITSGKYNPSKCITIKEKQFEV